MEDKEQGGVKYHNQTCSVFQDIQQSQVSMEHQRHLVNDHHCQQAE